MMMKLVETISIVIYCGKVVLLLLSTTPTKQDDPSVHFQPLATAKSSIVQDMVKSSVTFDKFECYF